MKNEREKPIEGSIRIALRFIFNIQNMCQFCAMKTTYPNALKLALLLLRITMKSTPQKNQRMSVNSVALKTSLVGVGNALLGK